MSGGFLATHKRELVRCHFMSLKYYSGSTVTFSCDWGWDRRGRPPKYWDYVKHGACHWLVNFNLELANLAKPKRIWRILMSDK